MAGSLIPLEGTAPRSLAGRQRSGMLDAARSGVQSSFAVVTYKGRSWRLKFRGEVQLVRDAANRPMPDLDVVIVGVAPNVSKIYYEKSYVEGDDNPPDCYSLDGIAPDANVPKRQNPTCGNCPKNAWGSRVTDAGKRAKACQDSRRIALVPLGDIANESLGGPMLLRIPPTSLPNLANYADFLQRKGADLPWVGTRLSFDENVAYPKIQFSALGFLDDEQADQVAVALENPLIERMLTDAAPTVSAPAPAAEPDLGKPPRRLASGNPGNPGGGFEQPRSPNLPPQRQPEPDEEQEEQEETEQPPPPPAPEPPQRAAETTVRPKANPFTAATKAAQTAPKKINGNAGNGVTRRAPATQQPAAAPADLESAINDLLTDV